MSNTLNLILDKYRNDGEVPALSLNLGQKEKHRCLRISPENKAFLELKKVASISYTINCILTNEQRTANVRNFYKPPIIDNPIND